MGDGVNYMVMNGNQTYSGDYSVVYTNTDLQRCTLAAYIMLYTSVTSIK